MAWLLIIGGIVLLVAGLLLKRKADADPFFGRGPFTPEISDPFGRLREQFGPARQERWGRLLVWIGSLALLLGIVLRGATQ